ncbi:glycoside hydrolase family 43 protein [Paenibacillus sp. CN-4]|uniref:glycoside hydrolase family 43 protein n=1 Tax=Paenibacillus nanchangensis TaxID=3348343 RepID=UPI00397CAC33
MKYNNPVIKGFYPDPSVCKVNERYYLVCSSFQYFPGVPIFESKDLINWTQIGHCLTRKSQVQLESVNSSGGVFAPTLRYANGRFYMTTTNDTLRQNFYVWTDNIYGEWSDPIFVDQGGIDPDLFFEDGKTYFMSNGTDDNGVGGIVQCEIDIETGRKLTPSTPIWQGTGGRYLESPHLYKINGRYYLLAAEGGTEYGHMVIYARGDSPSGPFEAYPHNPVLTNRNLGGYELQGVGHSDLVQDDAGNWWLLHLGFRQIGQYLTFHHLGREVFLTPVTFGEDGWFTAGHRGTTLMSFETGRIAETVIQQEQKLVTFENTNWNLDWCYLRHPDEKNYQFDFESIKLTGTGVTLDDPASPTFIGIRQRDFHAVISCEVSLTGGEAGITLYMDENHHYDLAIRAHGDGYEVIERLNIGDIKSVEKTLGLGSSNHAALVIKSSPTHYHFYVQTEGTETMLGSAQTRYLSSEVAGGFTGVMIGLYATGDGLGPNAEFTRFSCEYA